MSRQFEVMGVLSLLSCCLAGSEVLASVPTPNPITPCSHSLGLHQPSRTLHPTGAHQRYSGGDQHEGGFGVEVSLVSNWLLGGYEGQPGITDSGLVQMGESIP